MFDNLWLEEAIIIYMYHVCMLYDFLLQYKLWV